MPQKLTLEFTRPNPGDPLPHQMGALDGNRLVIDEDGEPTLYNRFDQPLTPDEIRDALYQALGGPVQPQTVVKP